MIDTIIKQFQLKFLRDTKKIVILAIMILIPFTLFLLRSSFYFNYIYFCFIQLVFFMMILFSVLVHKNLDVIDYTLIKLQWVLFILLIFLCILLTSYQIRINADNSLFYRTNTFSYGECYFEEKSGKCCFSLQTNKHKTEHCLDESWFAGKFKGINIPIKETTSLGFGFLDDKGPIYQKPFMDKSYRISYDLEGEYSMLASYVFETAGDLKISSNKCFILKPNNKKNIEVKLKDFKWVDKYQFQVNNNKPIIKSLKMNARVLAYEDSFIIEQLLKLNLDQLVQRLYMPE